MTKIKRMDEPVLQSAVYLIGKQWYILQEANGEAARIYRSTLMRCVQLNDGGNSASAKTGSEEDLLAADMVVLSMCLHTATLTEAAAAMLSESKITEDEVTLSSLVMGPLVSLDVINSWPDRISQPLCADCKQLSELDNAKLQEVAAQDPLDLTRLSEEQKSTTAGSSLPATSVQPITKV